jgi:hypothetical protein
VDFKTQLLPCCAELFIKSLIHRAVSLTVTAEDRGNKTTKAPNGSIQRNKNTNSTTVYICNNIHGYKKPKMFNK